MEASWSLQVAIHQVLIGDTDLTSLLGGAKVYDHVRRGRNFPYISIGETQTRNWDSDLHNGGEHLVTLHVWSQRPDRKEALEILQLCYARLHDAHLNLTEHRLINLRGEFQSVRRDPDGETYHGILRLRAVTETV